MMRQRWTWEKSINPFIISGITTGVCAMLANQVSLQILFKQKCLPPAHFAHPFSLVLLDQLMLFCYAFHVIHAIYVFVWDVPLYCARPTFLFIENLVHGLINGFKSVHTYIGLFI